MYYIPDQYLGAVCEIKTMDNELLATGYISDIKEDSIEIKNKFDKMPLIRANKMVKITAQSKQDGFQVLAGTVFLSTDFFLRIVDIGSISNYEKRNFFRINVSLDSSGYFCAEKEDEGEEPVIEHFRAHISNLSLSGAFFTTDREFSLDQTVFLLIPINEATHFECRVRRIEKDPYKGTGYGCEFTNYTERQQDLFCNFIFEKQREIIRKAKQYD